MGQTYVSLTFLRDPRLAVDTRYEVLFSGQIGADGEATPGAGGLDEDNPLTATPIALFAYATMHPGDGVGEDGLGEDGLGVDLNIAGIGDGVGGYDGLGYDGEPADWVSWSTQSIGLVLRDGDYQFGVRFSDALGNIDEGELSTYSVSIRTDPRSARDLRIEGVDGNDVQMAWTPSRDIEAA